MHISKEYKSVWKKYGLSFGITCLALIVYFFYIYRAVDNVPIMDYWENFVATAEGIRQGNFTWQQFWTYGTNVHRNPFAWLLLYADVRWFHCNMLVRIYLGAAFMAGSVFLLYIVYAKRVINKAKSALLAQIFWVALLFAMLNLNQWEITTQLTAGVFMPRLFLYLLLCVWFEHLLCKNFQSRKQVVAFFLSFFVIANFISQAYFPALFVALFVAGILYYSDARAKKTAQHADAAKKFLVWFFAVMVVTTIVYLVSLQPARVDPNQVPMLERLTRMLRNGNVWKGPLAMLGASFLPPERSDSVYILGGAIFGLLQGAALFVYFRQRKAGKELSMLPLMMIVYGWANLPLILLVRGHLSIESLCASRYLVDTIWIGVGTLWMLAEYILAAVPLKKMRWQILLVLIGMCFLLQGVVRSDIHEWKMAPYRKEYYQNLQSLMRKEEPLTNEELALFQCKYLEDTQQAIAYMKKHRLSIFYKTSER